MADRRISTGTLTDIANAIRSKTGKSALITPQEMASEIESIETGGSGNATFVNLNDPDMWEQKDVASGSAVGASYEDCKTANATRITTKELVPFDSFVALKISNNYTLYMLLFDENKKYISYRGGWFDTMILGSGNFSKVSGSKSFSDAKFASLSMRKGTTGAEITPSEVENLVVQYISGG